MQNNLFYSRYSSKKKPEKIPFKKRKENTLASLNEVERFLGNYRHFMKYVKLYRFFR